MSCTVVFLDRGNFPETLVIPRPKISCEWVEYPFTDSDDVFSRISTADVVLTSKVVLRKSILDQCPRLKLIVALGTGCDHIDLDAAHERKITVCNCFDYGTSTVAEHTLSFMLSLCRNTFRYARAISRGRWQKSKNFYFLDYPISEMKGKNLCIFGKGSVGREVARLAENFGIKVFFAERKNSNVVRDGYISFYEAVKKADFVTLHVPLTKETAHLFSTEEFELMKKEAFFINVSRGAVVDEKALVKALVKKEIAGAAFDVVEKEPPEKSISDHPLLRLLDDDTYNVIASAHVAWASLNAMSSLLKQTMENIDAFYCGKPVRIV